MAKFCGKCGSNLDEATGLCPNCDSDKLNKQISKSESVEKSKPRQNTIPESEKPLSKKRAKKKRKTDKKAEKKVKKKEKRTPWPIGKKCRRFILKLMLSVLLLGVFVFGGTGVLVYFNILEVPIVSNVLERTGFKQELSTFSNHEINDSYIPSRENIVYENESKTSGYVNNMILLFVYSDVPVNRISEIAENLGGKIVGEISGIHQYQIQVSPMSKGELEILCSKAMEFEEVKYAIIDAVFAMETEEIPIPDDPWKDVFQGVWGTDWNEEKPSGYNWWLEATKVPSAWQYRDSFSTINVGIVDNGFDTSHEDLDITVLNNTVNNAEHHGTHVAGIIGAINNNQIGITGILDQANLYGVDCYATSKQEKNNIAVSSLLAGIELCISNDCKVVNMSSGVSPTNTEETKANAEATARNAIIYLISILDSREDINDFIIVQSAGNGDRNNNGVDAEQYAGYFASITEDLVREVFEYFDENDVQLEHDISVHDVLDSYMVIGAVDKKQKKDAWQLSDFSNYGDTLTVCAPGVDVFSTTVMGGFNGNYANDTGTSMAAPIVSGITAMVWSVNPDMSAGEVKNIIQQTADITVASRRKADDGTYYMINATKAVEAALNYVPENSKNNQEGQFDQSVVPQEASEFNGHYYYVYNVDTVTTWEEAKKYCESQGGYLATITSKEEDEFVYSYLRNNFDYESAYFGFTDQDTEGIWIWDNGETSSYTNWHSGEPNSENPNEDFAMYYYKYSDGSWNDGDFENRTVNSGKSFICEWGKYQSDLIDQTQEPVGTTPDDGDMKERDRTLYNQYLTNGGYEELIGDTDNIFSVPENLGISSVMYDVNGDGTYELLLEIIDTSTFGPAGSARLTFLLGIENENVKEYQQAYFTGGTMIGSSIYFLYDTETQKPVVVVNNAFKNGIFCYHSEMKVFSDDLLEPEVTWEESSFARVNGEFIDYEDVINEIRKETDLYFDDGIVFSCYKVNNQYVTEDEIGQVTGRFVSDDSIPELIPGTYDEPVAVLDLSSKELPNDDNYKDVIAEGASWREVYKNVLGSLTEEFSGYGLIYVDNNDVPELYLRGNGKDQRDRLYSISDGRLVETSNGGQLEYWETQGIFQYWSFQQNVSRTDCYIMENGSVKKVHVGSYHEQSGSTEYFWDGKPVSKDQYIQNLDAASGSQGDTLGREYSSSLEEILSQMEDTSIEGQILKKSIEESLNIRSFPRHDSDLAGTVESSSEVLTYNGATAEGLGSDGEKHNWHYVTTGTGVSGWIRGDLIVPDSGSLKMLDQSLRYYRKNVEASLNIRSLPQYDSNLVGTVSSLYEPLAFYGEIGVGYGSDGIMHEWYKITTSSGITGWVRSDLIWEEVG